MKLKLVDDDYDDDDVELYMCSTIFDYFYFGINKKNIWRQKAKAGSHELRIKVLRVALHYGGHVHWLVKNFSPRHGYLRQGMVCWRR